MRVMGRELYEMDGFVGSGEDLRRLGGHGQKILRFLTAVSGQSRSYAPYFIKQLLESENHSLPNQLRPLHPLHASMSHVTFGRGVLLRSACSPVFPFGNVSRHLAEFGSHCSGLAAAASAEPVTTSSGADLIQDLRFLEVAVSRVCLHSAVNVEGSLEPSKRSVYVDFKKAVRVRKTRGASDSKALGRRSSVGSLVGCGTRR